jgi:CheY-like chemotaxis protein
MEIAPSAGIPPIVLLVDNEDDARSLCMKNLQRSGLWVAAAADPDAAMNTAAELHPDIIVAGITLDGRTDGLRFLRAVAEHPGTRDTPLVVLTARPIEDLPRGAQEHASAVLVRPFAPDDLTREIHRVLAVSRGLRERSTRLTAKAHELRDRSNALLRSETRGVDRRRNCPDCGGPLEWLERGTIGGVEYDYYRWCAKGCGLHCYDRNAGKFVKLA